MEKRTEYKIHFELFNKFVNESLKYNTTGITRKKGDEIIEAIKKINQKLKIFDPKLKKRIQDRKFEINAIGELVVNDKKVVYMEDYFEKIWEIHSVGVKHPGITLTTSEINKRYSCIPRPAIEYFIKECSTCKSKHTKVSFMSSLIP
jgi:hypothetical protein